LRLNICHQIQSNEEPSYGNIPRPTMGDDSIENSDDLLVFLEALAQPPPYQEDGDKAACEIILNDLSAEELAQAAESSYAFWFVSSKAPSKLPQDAQKVAALKEIRRHFVGEGRIAEKALAALREAMEMRETYKINKMRTIFYEKGANGDDDAEKTRVMIREDLVRQPMVVRGRTKGGKSALCAKPARKTPTDAEENTAYILTQLYTAERLLSTVEYLSKGTEEKVLVLFSFLDYNSNQSVTKTALKEANSILSRVYPERLQRLYVFEPTWFIWALHTFISPFLPKDTREKVQLVSGTAKTEAILNDMMYNCDQEFIQMLNKGIFGDSMDLDKYLIEVPFYRLYDDVISG